MESLGSNIFLLNAIIFNQIMSSNVLLSMIFIMHLNINIINLLFPTLFTILNPINHNRMRPRIHNPLSFLIILIPFIIPTKPKLTPPNQP